MVRSMVFAGVMVAIVVSTACPSFGYTENVLFYDGFDGEEPPDPCKWQCREETSPRDSGITELRGWPEVRNSMATFSHHTYNDAYPGGKCLSQEMFTIDEFDATTTLIFEARVRLRPPARSGLVAGFYVYGDKAKSYTDPNLVSDEIDYEFLTNQVNDPYPVFLGHRVYVGAYNDFEGNWMDDTKHWWANPNVPKIILGNRPQLDLTEFNIFQIRWLGDRVEWYWQPEDGGDPILIYKTSNVLPDDPMGLYLNFWGADIFWPIAWDASLQPVVSPEADSVSYYDVDYVKVSQLLPSNCLEVRALGQNMPMDFNGDCIINLVDFVELASDWLECNDPEDMNCD